jgi:hypothetical protein
MSKRFKQKEITGDKIDETLANNITDLFRNGMDDAQYSEGLGLTPSLIISLYWASSIPFLNKSVILLAKVSSILSPVISFCLNRLLIVAN